MFRTFEIGMTGMIVFILYVGNQRARGQVLGQPVLCNIHTTDSSLQALLDPFISKARYVWRFQVWV